MSKYPRVTISELIYGIHEHCINFNDREIYIHGASGDGIEHITSMKFIKNLHILDQVDNTPILVHMHVNGGSWPDGLAMFDAIKKAKSSVTILAYSAASSMSGVLLQAAEKRIMMPNTHFMIHYGSIGFDDMTSNSATATVNFNEAECQKMVEMFAERAVVGEFFREKHFGRKQIVKYIHKMIQEKGDWYMSSEEAVHYGFADEIHK